MKTLLTVVAFALCAPSSAAPITVASKAFTESRVLGEMLALLLEHEGVEIERKLNLGGTAIVFNALKAGEVDLYVEYTGTAAAVLLDAAHHKMSPLEVFARVQQKARTAHDLVWWAPLGFNNTYAITMLRARADALGISQLSDLQAHPSLKFGVTHEFLQRDDGWPGMSSLYGLRDHKVSGLDHGLAFEALKSGAVDLVDAYSTDGKLADDALLVLDDDRGFFPPYDAAALVRRAVLSDARIGRALDKLSFRIDAKKMRALNRAAERDGGRYRAVAKDFLAREGLLGDDVKVEGARPALEEKKGLFAFMIEKRGDLLRLVAEHLTLTLLAVLLGVLLAVPLGIWLTRRARLRPILLGAAGALQTIPSLALLAFLIPIPIFGLGTHTAVFALFLYALLPILRNTVTGILEVDDELKRAAVGIGLSDVERLRHVELPLAMPTILAGIRTATVISVGVATLAAFIGAGGLGEPIITGLQLNDTRLILMGALPAALLALLLDGLLGFLENKLTRVR